MPRNRPFSVTLLLWLVLSLSAWGVVRWQAALRTWDVLTEFGARLSPQYLSISGAVWTVVGLGLLWALFRGKEGTRFAIAIAVFLWIMQYWGERLFFESPRPNAPFALLACIVLFGVTLISTLNPKTKSFLSRSEAHEQPNENTESA